MKSLITTIVILSFLGVGTLGFAAVGHSAGHEKPNCFVSSLAGDVVCPENLISFVNYHASAIASLGLVILTFGAALLLSFLVLTLGLPSLFPIPPPGLRVLSRELNRLLLKASIEKRKILSWLSLFELSPAS